MTAGRSESSDSNRGRGPSNRTATIPEWQIVMSTSTTTTASTSEQRAHEQRDASHASAAHRQVREGAPDQPTRNTQLHQGAGQVPAGTVMTPVTARHHVGVVGHGGAR